MPDFDSRLVQRIEVLLAQALQRVDMAEGLARIAEAKGYAKSGNKYVRDILRRTEQLHSIIFGKGLASLGENGKKGYFNRTRSTDSQG